MYIKSSTAVNNTLLILRPIGPNFHGFPAAGLVLPPHASSPSEPWRAWHGHAPDHRNGADKPRFWLTTDKCSLVLILRCHLLAKVLARVRVDVTSDWREGHPHNLDIPDLLDLRNGWFQETTQRDNKQCNGRIMKQETALKDHGWRFGQNPVRWLPESNAKATLVAKAHYLMVELPSNQEPVGFSWCIPNLCALLPQ